MLLVVGGNRVMLGLTALAGMGNLDRALACVGTFEVFAVKASTVSVFSEPAPTVEYVHL